MKIVLEHYHPGIPGYDVTYSVQVYKILESGKQCRLTTAQFELTCDEAPLTFWGNRITVPASFKDNTDKTAVVIKATTIEPDPKIVQFQLPIKNWKKTFEENFEGDKLNEEYWSCPGSWNVTDIGGVTIASSPESLKIHDNMLTIFYQRAKGRKTFLRDGKREVSPDLFSSSVFTRGKFEQQFGCYTCKMRIAKPPVGACNPAFWLMPPTDKWGHVYLFRQVKGKNAGFGCGEIDIIEYSPQWKPPHYQITDHWWSAPGVNHVDDESWHYADELWDGDFHEYSCVWTESDMYYYFDGKLVKEQHDLVPTGEPAHMLLSLGSSGAKNSPATWIGEFDPDNLEGMSADFTAVKVYE